MIHPLPGRLAATVIPILLGTTACPAATQANPQLSTSIPAVSGEPAAPLPQVQPLTRRAPSRAARRSQPSAQHPGPRDRVGAANAAARVQPEGEQFLNAIQNYVWTPGALYQVYASPGQVTDIALQEGEQLVGTGPVAAGDTVRWLIGDTISGRGPTARVHILVKPIRSDITTNLVINTDRRTYHIELRANPSVYMASVSWTYPQDELIALRQAQEAEARAMPVAANIPIAALNFAYRVSGDRPAWRPVRVFDDGRQTFVEFPENVAQGEMPPLFVLGEGDQAELVNYRVSGRFMIVDRLLDRAELRLGDRRSQQRVEIRGARRRAAQ
ncbi:MAG: P-type conjugative transfer protein TrbG [Sphingopyxis sp.]|nr:P-type conjugative transfer protein TrbG [Sphingopyxis sp.]